jgi:sugar phosphate isomerase/epimerase
MQAPSSRRTFLKKTVAAAILGSGIPIASVAVEPFRRAGTARLSLSLAAYSFRDSFTGKTAKKISLFDFVDYCAEQGCQGAELTSYYFPTPVTTEFLIKLKRHAFLRGIEISGSAVGNNFAVPAGEKRDAQVKLVKDWVDHAAILGAPHIRVFAGSKPKNLEVAEAKKLCIEALEESSEYAGNKGIFLGLENHGGIVAESGDLLDIVRTVKSPWLGVNLDTGNFQTDDPYADLAKCAPYAVNVQLKAEVQPRGKKKEEADVPRLIRILRDANYQGYVALEYEAAEDAWTGVPTWLKKMKQAMASA